MPRQAFGNIGEQLGQAQPEIRQLIKRVDSLEETLDAPVWTLFTPTLTASTTNPTLGTGSTRQGRYIETIGGVVVYRFYIQFGSSGAAAGSGEYKVSVPVPISGDTPSLSEFALGTAVLFDWSTSGHREVASIGRDAGGNTLQFETDNGAVWHNSPFTWANDDRFGGTAVYQAA